MKANTLGKLTRVDLQECMGQGETFGEWLAQDDVLRMIGETVGEELILDDRERREWGSPSTMAMIPVQSRSGKGLIVGQWETSSDEALGRLIALTAHVQPALVIWIAKEFSESHRQVFEWLNQTLEHLIDWVSVDFELWRIDDSPPAPKFSVVPRKHGPRMLCATHDKQRPLPKNAGASSQSAEKPQESAGQSEKSAEVSAPVSVRENFVYTKSYS